MKTLIDRSTQIAYSRANNDVNGNPRYIVHFLNFVNDIDRMIAGRGNIIALHEIALKKSREIGGKKYRGNDYGGGIVFQSYNIEGTLQRIAEIKDSISVDGLYTYLSTSIQNDGLEQIIDGMSLFETLAPDGEYFIYHIAKSKDQRLYFIGSPTNSTFLIDFILIKDPDTPQNEAIDYLYDVCNDAVLNNNGTIEERYACI